eukprot:418352_1
MSDANYYALLGVNESASIKDITSKWKQLNREFHPDKNAHIADTNVKANENRLKEINNAYATLKDATLRDEYDKKHGFGKYRNSNHQNNNNSKPLLLEDHKGDDDNHDHDTKPSEQNDNDNGTKKPTEETKTELPESKIDSLKTTDGINKPDISAHDTNTITTGGGSGDTNIIVDDLEPAAKAYLFKGTRRLLYGRYFDTADNLIKEADYPLFELLSSDDVKEWDNAIIPIDRKKVDIRESYSAIQTNFTESGYNSATVTVGIPGLASGSFGISESHETSDITTNTTLTFTAISRILKGRIVINGQIVKYRDDFLNELDKLLSDDVIHPNKWKAFTTKYGEYYISRCKIGGSVYTSKQVTVNSSKHLESQKLEFRASFDATIEGVSIGASAAHGTGTGQGIEKENTKTSISLQCHGGNAALCGINEFGQWEVSVNSNYKLWDIISVDEVKPIFDLLEKAKGDKVKGLRYLAQLKI